MTTSITVASRPRSGTTWLIRLLADTLDSPAVAHYREQIDKHEYFSDDRNSDYLIQKTHDSRYFGNPTVVIMRDPRDVVISRMHWNPKEYGENPTQCIQMLGKCYEAWHLWWEHKSNQIPQIVLTKYESLHQFQETELQLILEGLGITPLPKADKIKQAFENQSFERMHMEHPHAARKGIIGDWKNYFNRGHGQLITEILGDLMLRVGYINSLDWWKTL